MAQFFTGIPDRLELFGTVHISLSIITVLLAAVIFLSRHRLKKLNSKSSRFPRIAMATILAANMAVHYISKLVLGIWRFDTDLPFHICFITNFFLIFILLTDNKHDLYRIIYYFTFIGPLPAMIWPDLDYGWQSYTFYQFIISHHVMLLISVYCLFVLDYRVELRSALHAFVFGNGFIIAVSVFNLVFETNYIMIESLPQQLYEIYPFLDMLPPIVWLELVGVLAILAAYIPALFRDKSSYDSDNVMTAET